MNKFILLLFISLFNFNFAQIKGKITDQNGKELSYVNIFLENTYTSTTSNEQGKFELNFKKTGKYVVVFQYLGYKTKKENISIEQFPFELNVKMDEENFTLNDVVINTKVNPAIAIVKKAIASRKDNSEKTAKYTADFYSRGLLKIKNLPKKIMGIKLDLDLETASNLDSTGSGTVYLSETVSKLTYQKPNDLKEVIIASKIAGNSSGFSYNTARNTFYDFYENNIQLNIRLISPIANNAFNYYKYKLEGSFFDENNQLINKIKVIPRRDKEPVFEGYIYIVDDSWAIYAVDLDIKGYRMNSEFIENLNLKQNFSFNNKTNIWSKNSQSINFISGLFGIKYSGYFNYVFSNYEFKPSFEKNTFGNEIVTFESDANKKGNDFWETSRPIPLTDEENENYIKKDKLQIRRESKQYLDSLDSKKNKFSITDLITGYNYKKFFKKFSFDYSGVIDPSKMNFNTVQGYLINTEFSYKKWSEVDTDNKYYSLKANFEYGFSEKKFRFLTVYNQKFNSQNYADLTITAGSKVNQFKNSEPIIPIINTIATLFFKDNYMKLYETNFASVRYFQNIANGVNWNINLEYANRKKLFNNTDYSFLKKSDTYSSNNPTNEIDFVNAGFENHNLFKFATEFKINFGNKFISRPDEKFNIRNRKFPVLYFGLENAFASSEKKYNFTHAYSRVFYDLSLANKGTIGINISAGKFFNATDIAFMDFKHFNGNQTYVGTSNRYLNVFNLMPYYENSTNDSYLEFHAEYDDNGFIMNKLPLLNLLKTNLVVGFHNLAVPKRKPYSEFTIGLDNLGFGKFKIFRLDYIRSFENGNQKSSVIFGCKILDFL